METSTHVSQTFLAIRNLKVDDLCGHVLAVVRITPETRDVTVVLRGHYGETQSVH